MGEDTKALREECEGLARVLRGTNDVTVASDDEFAGLAPVPWAAYEIMEGTARSDVWGEGPTERAALLALRAALETACDEALDRLAKVRGKVVSDGR